VDYFEDEHLPDGDAPAALPSGLSKCEGASFIIACVYHNVGVTSSFL